MSCTANVEISKDIIREAKFANHWYRAALEEQKKFIGEEEKRQGLKRKLVTEMKEQTKKKNAIMNQASEEMISITSRSQEIDIQLNNLNDCY